MKPSHDVVLDAMNDQTLEIVITLFSTRRFINAEFFLKTNWTNVYRLLTLTGAHFFCLLAEILVNISKNTDGSTSL